MSALDLASLWIGRIVLLTGALALAVSVVAGLNYVLMWMFWHYARKIGFSIENWNNVRNWVQNGRPTWQMGSDGVYHMTPSAGETEGSDVEDEP